MKRILVTKVLPDKYGVGVIPEMEKPDINNHSIMKDRERIWLSFESEELFSNKEKAYQQHLASLPTFLIHPSLNPKEGGWIESYTEGYQVRSGIKDEWDWTTESIFNENQEKHRRKVILPLEKKEELKDCPDCWGSSWETQFVKPCVRCNGTGKVSASSVLLPLVEEKQRGLRICSTHCDWPNCTLPECIEKRSEGNTPASEQGDEDTYEDNLKAAIVAGIEVFLMDDKWNKDGNLNLKLLYDCIFKNVDTVLASQSPPSLPEAEKANELVEFAKQFEQDPYPEDIFLPVSKDELKNIHEMLKRDFGMPLDRLTGHIGRLLRRPLSEQAKTAISNYKK